MFQPVVIHRLGPPESAESAMASPSPEPLVTVQMCSPSGEAHRTEPTGPIARERPLNPTEDCGTDGRKTVGAPSERAFSGAPSEGSFYLLLGVEEALSLSVLTVVLQGNALEFLI